MLDLNDNRQRKLAGTTGGDLHPGWSPDGKSIVFQSQRAQPFIGEFDMYVVGTDGRGLQRLTDNRNSISPAWLKIPRNPLIQHPDCTSGWTRLEAGDQASVSRESTTPNRVRSSPSTSDEITMLLHPGSVMKLVEGPVCAGGLVFWKIENDSIPGGVGWTAEGDGQEYWLEPYVP